MCEGTNVTCHMSHVTLFLLPKRGIVSQPQTIGLRGVNIWFRHRKHVV